MSEVHHVSATRLTLDIWHPNCWAIEATERVGGGVLAHAFYHSPKTDDPEAPAVNGLFTAFGENRAEVDELLDKISSSKHTGDVRHLQQQLGQKRDSSGNTEREFFLEYDPSEMICPVLLEHGLVQSEPVRIEDGRESWQLCFTGDRADLEDALDGVRQDADAQVSVEAIHTAEWDGESPRRHRFDMLTDAQREAFDHARQAGYYRWPRETSTRELAGGLGVSKTTFLEHLRKAESKLLDPENERINRTES